ncbi:LysR family transcriptional regulator [Aestuariicella hydrocarbonica]|uniref:LysR family transcriptional regulator n=1 Tax=Pseudomaricurvus hydrocarbonicus TaxID=1470433 RepID=A0A9E5JTV5_9GAMM|nr:LysR family transcriptional regulator [Aestuariicella hydrocarbonica]NHO66738.1 LysR family transcriptional regulator [Aestuariicella hydrocarbonica]
MSESLNDLRAFTLVAEAGSFTKAAGQMGVSQSALSHTIKALEKRIGIKLLNRTTRSVSTTQAGEQLLNDIAPLISGIEQKLSALNEFRSSPRGTLRINGTEHVIHSILWDKLSRFAHDYPDIHLEITTDYTLTDIVKDRYDIGIRLGHAVDKDMIAVRITPDMQMMVVASPEYVHTYGNPNIPSDLDHHRCLALRLPTHENLMNWELQKSGDGFQKAEIVNIHPRPVMIFSHAHLLVKAAVDGLGLAWVPALMVKSELQSGKLVSLLDEWVTTYDGYYLYYPNRRQSSPLFRLLVDALRLK